MRPFDWEWRLRLPEAMDLHKIFSASWKKGSHSGFDEDEYAEYMASQFAETPPGTHVSELFRARNYFDGGYFEEALVILNSLSRFILE